MKGRCLLPFFYARNAKNKVFNPGFFINLTVKELLIIGITGRNEESQSTWTRLYKNDA